MPSMSSDSTASQSQTSPSSRLPTLSSLSPNSLTRIPRQWLTTYQEFVRQNASQVSSVESGLRSLTYVLPGRFHESPLTSEGLYTSLTLLTTWHTHILSPVNSPHTKQRLSPQNRYEKWCRLTGGKLYSNAAALLRTLQYTQLLLEMFAKRAGEKVRWRVVVILELVKAICRLTIMRFTGNRPVIATGIGAENQERVISEKESKDQDDSRTSTDLKSEAVGDKDTNGHIPNGHTELPPNTAPPVAASSSSSQTEYIMPRTGLRLPTSLPTPPSSISSSMPSSPTSESIQDYLSNRTLTPDDLHAPPRLVQPLLTTRAQVAELLWILRPVIYAIALQHLTTSNTTTTISSSSSPTRPHPQNWKRSWTPWLLGLSIEVLSRHLSKSEITQTRPGGIKSLSVVERDELRRRGALSSSFGWWALRGAFYENVTKDTLLGVAGRLKGKPLLDMFGVVIENYEWLWEEWYFATSTV